MSSSSFVSDGFDLIKKVFYNGLADFSLLFAGIFSSVVLARLLGPQQWGHYSQMMWLISFAGILANFGLTYTSMRFVANLSGREDKADIRPLVKWIFIVQLLLALLTSIVVFLFADQLVSVTGWQVDPILVRITSLGIFSYTLLQLGNAILRGLQEFRFLSILSIFSSGFILAAILFVLFWPGISTLILAISIGQFLLLPLIVRKIRTNLKNIAISSRHPFPEIWKPVLNYTILVFLTTLVDQIVWQRSEIFFLARLEDPSYSGFYSLSYTISTLAIGTLPVALTGILTPVFSSMKGAPTNLHYLFQKSFAYLNLIVFPSTVGLIIVAPKLIDCFYGERFLPAVPVLQIIAGSTAVGICTRPGASILHAQNKPVVLLLSGLVALPVDITLAWILIPSLYARGAAIANLVAQSVCAGLIMGYAIFIVGLRLNLISLLKTIFSSILCGLIARLFLSLEIPSLFSLLLAVLASSMTYLFSLLLLKDGPTTELLVHLKQLVNQKHQKSKQHFVT